MRHKMNEKGMETSVQRTSCPLVEHLFDHCNADSMPLQHARGLPSGLAARLQTAGMCEAQNTKASRFEMM
jgi:hypothetical protein